MLVSLCCQRGAISNRDSILNSIRREPLLEMTEYDKISDLPKMVNQMANRLSRAQTKVKETEASLKVKTSEQKETQLKLDFEQKKFKNLLGRAKKMAEMLGNTKLLAQVKDSGITLENGDKTAVSEPGWYYKVANFVSGVMDSCKETVTGCLTAKDETESDEE